MRRSLVWRLVLIGLVVLVAVVVNVGRPIALGTDLRGGFQVVFQARLNPATPPGARAAALQEAVDVLANRADGLGVAQARVQALGAERILVEIPGATNADEVIRTLRATSVLEWIASDQPLPLGALVTTSTGPPGATQMPPAIPNSH